MNPDPRTPAAAAARAARLRRRLVRTVAGLLLGAAAVATAQTAPGSAPPAAGADHGRRLFEGQAPLDGRLGGHPKSLPVDTIRCMNCHRREPWPAGTPAAQTQGYGPILDAASLRTPTPRRGGPPSRYDAASLCRLLRDGVDPAYVLIDRSMPRYRIGDADCAALWRHLAGADPR